MFGIRGLDPFGLFHSLCGVAALLFGLAVIVSRKGTRSHRRLGYAYVGAMLLLNATALMIYDLFGRFGPFHIAALVSLATVAAGLMPAFRRKPTGAWLERHAALMSWSYVGLVAAFIAEVIVRLPGARIGWSAFFGIAVAMAVGGYLIHTRVPHAVARFRPREGRTPEPT
jgi:uncharacterized membrane protein